MTQRTSEWLDQVDIAYHERQFAEPYRSTVAFCDWLEEMNHIGPSSKLRILDVGSGEGANVFYMAKRYPNCEFTGVDINPDLVEKGNYIFRKKGIQNCYLELGDLYNFPTQYEAKFDGVISLQTLSWLPEYTKPIAALARLNPGFIALSSLFFDGEVSCTIEVKDYSSATSEKSYKESFYNIYSLPNVLECLADHGFADAKSTAFEIDIDLPKPEKRGMGTYTQTLVDGHRLQISGPLLMPWHFVVASRST